MLAAGGDGDGFSIGGGHLPHAIRRNIDITYIVMDNQIYGLTKGQLSPTSPRGLTTASSSYGSLEDPVNPLLYVLGYGARFVAQGTPADMAGLATLIEEGIRYPGLRVHQRAVAVHHVRPARRAAQGAQDGHEEPLASIGHDSADRITAMELAQEYGETLYTGVFYRDPNPGPTYDEAVAHRQEQLAAKATPARAHPRELHPAPVSTSGPAVADVRARGAYTVPPAALQITPGVICTVKSLRE